MFSALEVSYDNSLYKFTFDIDIDIDIIELNDKGHLALGGIAANVTWRKGTCTGSSVVPLYGTLWNSSNHFAVCNSLATISNANFDWGFNLKSSLPMGIGAAV